MLGSLLRAIKIITSKCRAWSLVLSRCLISSVWRNRLNIPIFRGQAIYSQTAVPGAYCAGCHGPCLSLPPGQRDAVAGRQMWNPRVNAAAVICVILVNLPSPERVAFHGHLAALSDGGQASYRFGYCRRGGGSHVLRVWLTDSPAHALIKYLGPQEPCLQY